MAIWQFDFAALPRAKFEGFALDGSVVLEQYFVSSVPPYDENEELENYWQGLDTSIYWDSLSEIFGEKEDYWGSGVIFGEEDKTCAQVWDDEISFRLDMNNFDPVLCKAVVELGKKYDLLFLYSETGQLHAPNLPSFLNQVKSSRSNRFIENPVSTLVDAGDLFNRDD